MLYNKKVMLYDAIDLLASTQLVIILWYMKVSNPHVPIKCVQCYMSIIYQQT